MATEQQLIEGIRRADAAGDSEGVKVLGKHLLAMRSAPKAPPQGNKMGGLRAAGISTANGISANFLDRAAAGIGSLLPDMGPAHASVWNGHSLGDAYDLNLQQVRGYKDELYQRHPAITTAGEIAGAVAPMVATGGGDALRRGAARTAAAVGVNPRTAIRAGRFAASVAPDIAYGMAYGAGQSKDLTNAPDVAKNMATQGALALGGNVAGRAIAKGGSMLIKPKAVPKDVRMLADAGVILTPGQRAGGARRALEDKISGTIPVAGDAIAAQRRRGVEQFSRATVGKTLAPIGVKLPRSVETGTKAVQYARNKLGAAYDDVLSRMQFKVDGDFQTALADLQTRVNSGALAEPQAKQFDGIVQNWVTRKIDPNTGAMDGETLKKSLSEIGRLGNKYAKSTDGSQAELGDALLEFMSHMKDAATRHSAPEDVARLGKVDEGWANYVRVRNASAAAARKSGAFGPGDLMSAIKVNDKSIGKSALASGEALMQDWAQAGVNRLPSTVPDSGTTGRWLVGAPLVGGGSMISPLAIPAAVGGAVPYLPKVDALLQRRALASKPIRSLIGNSADQLATPFGMLGTGYAVTNSGR